MNNPEENFTKLDDTKPRVDLVEPAYILGLAEVLTFGVKKYAANNWKKMGKEDIARIYSATQRHLLAYKSGEIVDSESGISHINHASFGLMVLQWAEETHGWTFQNETLHKPVSECRLTDKNTNEWRLPTKNELEEEHKNDSTEFFKEVYWTSEDSSDNEIALTVDFKDSRAINFDYRYNNNFVRYVRTLPDLSLMWKDCVISPMTWYEAMGYTKCELTGAKDSEWRLPTKSELEEAYANGIVGFNHDYYWSSTGEKNEVDHCWTISFKNGDLCNGYKNNSRFVRCIRTMPDNSLEWSTSSRGKLDYKASQKFCEEMKKGEVLSDIEKAILVWKNSTTTTQEEDGHDGATIDEILKICKDSEAQVGYKIYGKVMCICGEDKTDGEVIPMIEDMIVEERICYVG